MQARIPFLRGARLGDFQHDTSQIFAESRLLSRLEGGQIDASSDCDGAVISHKLPFIERPALIDLSDPSMIAGWYSKVHFGIQAPDARRQQLSSRKGQHRFHELGHGESKGGDLP